MLLDNGLWEIERGVWGDSTDKDVCAVLQSVYDIYKDTFGKDFVLRDNDILIVTKSNVDHPYLQADLSHIYLCAADRRWAQFLYQFGHELFHYTCGNGGRIWRHQWFEEMLCETSSLYVLNESAKRWKADPPYPNWADYSSAIQKYYDDQVAADDIGIYGHELAQSCKDIRKSLEVDPYYDNRRVIKALSAILYKDILKGNPSAWESFKVLRFLGPCKEMTFEQYLSEWYTKCNEEEKGTVKEIAKILEINIK